MLMLELLASSRPFPEVAMFRTSRALSMCALVILVLALSPVAAHAAPIAWQSVDVVLHEDGSPLMIVSGTAPAGTALPAEGTLSAPPGAVLKWAGEVLGGPLDQDPPFDPTVEQSDDADIYSFTLEQGLYAQLELSVPTAVAQTPEAKTATIEWTATQDIPVVRAMIRIPESAEVTTGTPGGAPIPGPTGFVFYEREYSSVQAGDRIEFSVTYVPPAGGAAAPVPSEMTTSGDSSDIMVPVLLIAAGLGVGLMLYLGRRKSTSETAGESDDTPENSRVTDPTVEGVTAPDDHLAEEPVRRTLPKGAITAVVAIVFVVIVYAGITLGSRPDVANGVISAQIAQVDACTSSTYPLDVPDGVSLEDAADEIFDALRMTQGVGLVEVFVDDPRVEVGYCESSNSEAAIGEVLGATGYVAAQ